MRPAPGERSPQPKGQRPRSAQRQVVSHPLHISSDESFETELGPLGRSMEAGPLKQVRLSLRHHKTIGTPLSGGYLVLTPAIVTSAESAYTSPLCVHIAQDVQAWRKGYAMLPLPRLIICK